MSEMFPCLSIGAQASSAGPQRRCGVQRPIAPCRSCQAVLEEHPDDGHHGEAPIGQLGSQLRLPLLRILNFANKVWEADAVVAWLCVLRRVLHLAKAARPTAVRALPRKEASGLNHTAEGHDLSTPENWQLGQGCKPVGHICELDSRRRRQ